MSASLTPPSGVMVNVLLLSGFVCGSFLFWFSSLLPFKLGSLHGLHFFSFQVQKKNYRQEKKRAAKELFSALKDPSVVIISNWLKV